MGKSRVLETQGNVITNPYGNGHGGVDLGWQDTPTDYITAHSEGQVVFCQTGMENDTGSTGNASYGNCVKIAHPNGWYTLYAHMSQVLVAYGEYVDAGRRIGKMGNTGNSYGNHLHFEVRDAEDSRIDPAPYIAADLPYLPTNPGTDPAGITLEQVEKIAAEAAAKAVADYEKKQAEKNPIYNSIQEVPDFWREDIRNLVDAGVIAGTGKALGLSMIEARMAVICKRMVDKAVGNGTLWEGKPWNP